jgi:hypothetical protein
MDYSSYLTGHWFWLQIFPFTWLGILILTAACSVYLTWTHWFWLLNTLIEMGHTAVRPVNKGCLLLLGTWSHPRYIRGSVLAHLFICLVIPTWISRLFTLRYLGHCNRAVRTQDEVSFCWKFIDDKQRHWPINKTNSKGIRQKYNITSKISYQPFTISYQKIQYSFIIEKICSVKKLTFELTNSYILRNFYSKKYYKV